MFESFTEEEVKTLILLLIFKVERMKQIIEAKKKNIWNEIGLEMGKTGKGCQKVAKELKLECPF
jgi:hypothetical protein